MRPSAAVSLGRSTACRSLSRTTSTRPAYAPPSAPLLRGHRAGPNADVARRLREAGAVLIGKTVLHEFAYGDEPELTTELA